MVHHARPAWTDEREQAIALDHRSLGGGDDVDARADRVNVDELPLLIVDECGPRVNELATAQVGDLDEHLRRRGSLYYKRTGSLAEVAQLLGDSSRVAADHYVYALTDDREVDRSIALARVLA